MTKIISLTLASIIVGAAVLLTMNPTSTQATTTPILPPLYHEAQTELNDTGLVTASTSQEIIEAEFASSTSDIAVVMSNVARCESQYRQYDSPHHVLHGNINQDDIGVLQTNIDSWGDYILKSGIDPYTLSGNIELAKHILAQQGLNAWAPSKKCWEVVT